MEIFSTDFDGVIKGYFATGRVTYQYAIDNLIGLIDKLDFQRKFQNERFYQRLEADLQTGCIMPAITIAFVHKVNEKKIPSSERIKELVDEEIENGFILDGIQRLNTIRRVIDSKEHKLDLSRFLYINIIICNYKDNLLYRMVTLNNGQKPMTARHQIEMLASSLYNFKGYGFEVYTEKEQQNVNARGAFKKADLINSYISFLSNSTNLDNKKIIENKLDELVARKVIESKITESKFDFDSILKLIGKFSALKNSKDWLRNGNNLMGFTVALRDNFEVVNDLTVEEFSNYVQTYEQAFKNINVSKIKLSRERKRLASFYFKNFKKLSFLDSDELTLELASEL